MSLIGEEDLDVGKDRETSRLDTCHAGIPTTVPGCFQVSEQGRGLQAQLDTERRETDEIVGREVKGPRVPQAGTQLPGRDLGGQTGRKQGGGMRGGCGVSSEDGTTGG